MFSSTLHPHYQAGARDHLGAIISPILVGWDDERIEKGKFLDLTSLALRLLGAILLGHDRYGVFGPPKVLDAVNPNDLCIAQTDWDDFLSEMKKIIFDIEPDIQFRKDEMLLLQQGPRVTSQERRATGLAGKVAKVTMRSDWPRTVIAPVDAWSVPIQIGDTVRLVKPDGESLKVFVAGIAKPNSSPSDGKYSLMVNASDLSSEDIPADTSVWLDINGTS